MTQYIVTRTSHQLNGSHDEPCAGAKVVSLPVMYKMTSPLCSDWYDTGINHREENGVYYKENGHANVWVIENFDLLNFVAFHGPCIIEVDALGRNTLEIYDDYRE